MNFANTGTEDWTSSSLCKSQSRFMSEAQAIKCRRALVEPPDAETNLIPFSRLASPRKWFKERFSRVRFTICSPTSLAWRSFFASKASMVADPKGARPQASRKHPMVLAVPIMEQVPGDAQKRSCQERKVGSSISWLRIFPMASLRSEVTTVRSSIRQGSMAPAVRKMVGRFSRMAAMSMPGMILSHEQSITMPSKPWALTMASTEEAMRSRMGRI